MFRAENTPKDFFLENYSKIVILAKLGKFRDNLHKFLITFISICKKQRGRKIFLGRK